MTHGMVPMCLQFVSLLKLRITATWVVSVYMVLRVHVVFVLRVCVGSRVGLCVGDVTYTNCVAVCCSVWQRIAVCCSVLQCVAVCCSVGDVTFTNETHQCTHLYVQNDSFIWVTWLICFCMSHIQMTHVTNTDVFANKDESCHKYRMTHSYGWHDSSVCVHGVVLHIQMSPVTCKNQSCHMSKWVMPLDDVTYTNESCHMYKWVTSHVQMSHATRWCHIYKWVMSHLQMSHATWWCHIQMSRAYTWGVISHMHTSHMYKWVTETYKSCHTYIYVYIYNWVKPYVCMCNTCV